MKIVNHYEFADIACKYANSEQVSVFAVLKGFFEGNLTLKGDKYVYPSTILEVTNNYEKYIREGSFDNCYSYYAVSEVQVPKKMSEKELEEYEEDLAF